MNRSSNTWPAVPAAAPLRQGAGSKRAAARKPRAVELTRKSQSRRQSRGPPNASPLVDRVLVHDDVARRLPLMLEKRKPFPLL